MPLKQTRTINAVVQLESTARAYKRTIGAIGWIIDEILAGATDPKLVAAREQLTKIGTDLSK